MQGPASHGLSYFTTSVELHYQWVPKLSTLVRRGWMGFPGILLGSQTLRWRVLGTILGAIVPGDVLLGR
jgi:hypothetical protein